STGLKHDAQPATIPLNKHTCEEAGGLAGEYIRWYNHSRIKQSLGWKSPVEYRTSQGLAV
uniref:IS3 family transposase n=1 Tax=uncultured Bifidobacterium sp. TaxID=165187 RepID=UPI0025948934